MNGGDAVPVGESPCATHDFILTLKPLFLADFEPSTAKNGCFAQCGVVAEVCRGTDRAKGQARI